MVLPIYVRKVSIPSKPYDGIRMSSDDVVKSITNRVHQRCHCLVVCILSKLLVVNDLQIQCGNIQYHYRCL